MGASFSRGFRMITVEDLINRSNSKNHFNDEQYWVDLIKDMKNFLNEDHPQEEKSKIASGNIEWE